LGLFGVSFASAILPSVSRSAASGNYEEFRKTVSRSTAMVLLMTIPSSVGLILLGRPIIGAIFQGGRFEVYDTQQTALALSCYCVGLAGYSATKILNPAFYALSDAKTPMWVSLVSVLMNFCLAELLMTKFHMGISALALSTSMVALGGCASLFVVLRRRLGGLDTRYLASRFVRICLACVAMGAPVWVVSTYISKHLGDSKQADLVNLAVSIPVGVAFFGGAAVLLRIGETASMAKAISARMRKLLTRTHARIHNK
jgi:putative peptidoglycan lipid II flippase